MARDTWGQWVGPISYEAFFAEHMSVDEPVPGNLVAPNYFDKIPTGKGKAEKDMYDPLINLIANAKLLDPTCVLVNTSNYADFDSYVEAQRKPDATCCLKEGYCKEDPHDEDYRPAQTKSALKERNPDNGTFFDKSQLCIEMKPDDVSPFNDPPKEISGEALREFQFENKTDEDNQARGQIGAALTEICARQHRTRAFFVFMNAKEVRFLLHDRCATLVTRAVDYRKESGVLAEFFWRFARLTPAQRGIDETVRLATSDERVIAMDKLKRWAPKKHRPVLVMGVPKPDGKMHEFAVWGAMAEPKTLHGRSTRTYPAVDLETGNVVFLKETWRADLSGMEKESDILKELNDKGVRYVPQFQYGDDIKQPYHTTNNHRYVKASWRAGSLRDVFKKTHHRFTELFVGNHLDKFTAPKNLLRAVSHAMIAHQDAYRVCSILHRDVSGNNVLLDDEENGCLNDWDMAKRVPRYLSNHDAAEEEDAAADQEKLAADKKREKLEKEEDLPELEAQDDDGGEEEDEYEEFSRHTYRTGTWYFMSALLLRHPEKVHSLHDDLESFFYVILFFTLQYLPVNLSQVQLVDFMQSVFEECRLNNTLGIDVGGEAKTSLFIRNDSQIMDLVFLGNRPLTAWVQHARFAFGQFHRYVEREDRPLISFSDKDEHATESAPRLTAGRQIPLPADILLRDHSYLLQLFEQALAPHNWPDNHKETAAVAQFIAPDTTQTPAGVKRTHEGDEATVTKRSRCDILLSRQGGVNSMTVPTRHSDRQRDAREARARKAKSLSGAGTAR
ncbi:hypothetical protein NLJ89_g8020 [Agrocybe chaxingu]|uniref:Protein kinase domain-containing protein n=1 Tax=Agrocybe chaxingu TaxID=84603 RepID=A0A9W8JW86_9AGAR|nr:hypothetical protein NLJ89_g8020 [Agrocybe chaxingu]